MTNEGETPREVTAFQAIIDGSLDGFINASRSFGEPLLAMAYMVKEAFHLQLEFILNGVYSEPANDFHFNQMIEPLSAIIREIQEFRHRNRHVDDYFNHLSTISESIVAMSWISVKPAPIQFVRDMRDAGQYFGNRVLSSHRGEVKHTNWINKWNQVLRDLEQYVKEFHTTGFNWNCAQGLRSSSARPVPPPPPPPMGPPEAGPMHPVGGDLMGSADHRNAFLEELNQGLEIVRILRPVHKGDGDRPDWIAIPASDAPEPVASPPPPTRVMPPARNVPPPTLYLDGKKWRVEHQKNNYGLVIENEDMSQSLAMYKCDEAGLEVRNKMNSVVIDNCKRSTVVLSDIISSVEVIRCDRVKIQCNGHVPLISIDNSESIQIFITPNSRDVEVVSSKSSSCNICLLETDGDYVELPVPEQIKTVLLDRHLQSTVIEKN